MKRFVPFAVLVRALLWPKAEELRIGIVADIATVTTMTKATALNVQADVAAGAKASTGLNALFGALLRQSTQSATPANDAGQPAALNDNGKPDAQTDPAVELQTDRQQPQDLFNLIALLQNTVPQQTVQADKNAATQSAAAGEPATEPNETANASVIFLPPQQVASSQPQSDDAAQITDPATATTPAAKDDQKKSADANSITNNNPQIAPDANLIVALAQQAQAAAVQTQPVVDNAATAAVAVNATPAATNAQSPLVRSAGQTPSGKDTAANSAKPAKPAAATDALKMDTAEANASDANAPQVDALKAVDGTKSDANTGLPATAHDAVPAPPAQSSASGHSANTAVSVAATAVQAPTNTASPVSADVNIQVAAQRRDEPSTSTMDTLGLTIAAKSADGIKHFDIRLDPPELGRVEIHLSLDDSGKAQANLVVDKPQTLELLQRDAANLTHSLNDAGVSLSNNGLNFSLRGQDRQSDSGSVVKGRSRALSVKAVVGTDAISNSSSIVSLAPDSVRLDIRV